MKKVNFFNLKKKILQCILLIVPIIVIRTSSLVACSCDTISFENAVNDADEIFIGKILKAEIVERVNGEIKADIKWEYHFEIQHKWKGNNDSKLILYQLGTSCDFWFDIYEKEYLVYANRGLNGKGTSEFKSPNNNLTTWLCSRTTFNHPWDENNWYRKDIERLNKRFPTSVQLNDFQFIKFFFENWKLILIGILSTFLFVFFNLSKRSDV